MLIRIVKDSFMGNDVPKLIRRVKDLCMGNCSAKYCNKVAQGVQRTWKKKHMTIPHATLSAMPNLETDSKNRGAPFTYMDYDPSMGKWLHTLKRVGENTYPFLNFNGCTAKFVGMYK